jgi:hypothetical protein
MFPLAPLERDFCFSYLQHLPLLRFALIAFPFLASRDFVPCIAPFRQAHFHRLFLDIALAVVYGLAVIASRLIFVATSPAAIRLYLFNPTTTNNQIFSTLLCLEYLTAEASRDGSSSQKQPCFSRVLTRFTCRHTNTTSYSTSSHSCRASNTSIDYNSIPSSRVNTQRFSGLRNS